MKNPFKAYQDYVSKTPRNSFDMSHRNNLSLPVGLLVPDLVQDVTAGDSMELDAAFAFNFLPMIYPVQTPIRINQYFFYVRYRNTWDNFKDFRFGNKECVHPYIDRPASFFKTCGLADYMGIPTTISVGDNGYVSVILDHDMSNDLRNGHSVAPLHVHTGVGTGAAENTPIVMNEGSLVSATPWFASAAFGAFISGTNMVDLPARGVFSSVYFEGTYCIYCLRVNNINHNFAPYDNHQPLFVLNFDEALVTALMQSDVYLVAVSDDGTDSLVLSQPLHARTEQSDLTTIVIDDDINSGVTCSSTLNSIFETHSNFKIQDEVHQRQG